MPNVAARHMLTEPAQVNYILGYFMGGVAELSQGCS